MSLSFRVSCHDESAARARAADLASAIAHEPISISAHGSELEIQVHHPLAILLSGAAKLLCCGCGRISRILCPERADDCDPRGAQGA